MRTASLLAIVAAGAAGCHRVVGLQPKAPPTVTAAQASMFALPSQTGTRVELATMLAATDVVLVFYRGHW